MQEYEFKVHDLKVQFTQIYSPSRIQNMYMTL